MRTQEESRRYNELFKEFEQFTNRQLTKKEIEFLKWIVKNDLSVEKKTFIPET